MLWARLRAACPRHVVQLQPLQCWLLYQIPVLRQLTLLAVLVPGDQCLGALLSVLLTLAAGCVQGSCVCLLHFVMKSIPSLGGCSSFCVTCLSVETCACKSNCMFGRTRYASGLPFTACAGFKCLPFMELSFELLAFALHARHRCGF